MRYKDIKTSNITNMKRNTFFLSLLTGFSGGAIVLIAYLFFSNPKENNSHSTVEFKSSTPVQLAESVHNVQNSRYVNLTAAAQKSVDAVVHVKTLSSRQSQSYSNPFLDFFFGSPGFGYEEKPVLSSGSGVIITEDGFIVTNNHVIENSNRVEVTLNDKRTFEAQLIGTDPSTDIALLKIEGNNFSCLPFGNSDSAKVGEWVLAVGNPFNLTSTVTAGIISAKARNINIINKKYGIESFIQTDAAVNPGNSGGALVNSKGELIGINTAIASHTGTFTGYSFAIPISIVQKVVSDLVEFGEVQRAILGIVVSDINSQLAEKFNLKVLDGVLVQQTEAGSPASKAGIEPGDVITHIGAIQIKTLSEFQDHLIRFRPGDEISLTINRNGKTVDKKAILQNRFGSTDIIKRTDVMNVLGAIFKPISKDDAKSLGIKGGLQVIDLEKGKLLNAGIRNGFIITIVNGQSILKIEDLNDALNKATKGGVYVEGIYPNGMRAYYAFGL